MLTTIGWSSVLIAVVATCACAPNAPPPRVGKAHDAAAKPILEEGPVRAERIAVTYGDPKRLAALLDRALVESPNRGAVRAVLVDESSGELIVFGTDAGIARARAFLSPGVAQDAGADDVEVIDLRHSDAQNVVHVVDRLVHGRVRVVADPATNAVVVSGDAASRARVKKLVGELDLDGRNAKKNP